MSSSSINNAIKKNALDLLFKLLNYEGDNKFIVLDLCLKGYSEILTEFKPKEII